MQTGSPSVSLQSLQTSFAGLWPLPALIAWGLAWGAYRGLAWGGAPLQLAAGCGVLAGLAAAIVGGGTPWRRVFIGAGFPLSLLGSGLVTGSAAMLWLVAALGLLLLYPLRSWRDAPLFPTPDGALTGLDERIVVSSGARIVDAGCGLGAGLIELRRVFPAARIEGLDWSWPLVIACRLRCRDALIRRADIWRADWSGYRLVYLFQRPESMPRAVEKAARELRPGAWLVSLEFPAGGLRPTACIEPLPGKPVWLYRAPFARVDAGSSVR